MAINYAALATGALGFTVALAWNDAVRTAVHSVFPRTDTAGTARATFVYAILVTLLVIFAVAVLNRARRLVHEFRGGAGGSPRGAGETFAPEPLVRLWAARA
jgi:Family of unknown function (DUF5654)